MRKLHETNSGGSTTVSILIPRPSLIWTIDWTGAGVIAVFTAAAGGRGQLSLVPFAQFDAHDANGIISEVQTEFNGGVANVAAGFHTIDKTIVLPNPVVVPENTTIYLHQTNSFASFGIDVLVGIQSR